MAKFFPADLWMRFFSACSNSFSTLYCFDVEQIVSRAEFRRPVLYLIVSNYLIHWDKFIAYAGPWTLLAFIFYAGQRNILMGIFSGVFLILLLGYTSILFEFRHIVHLAPVFYAVTIVIILEFVKSGVTLLVNIKKFSEESYRDQLLTSFRNGALSVLILIMGIVITYFFLRLWQVRVTQDIISALERAEWGRIEVTESRGDSNNILYQPILPLFSIDTIKRLPAMEVPYHYLRVDVILGSSMDIEITNKYSNEYPSVDFSESFDSLIEESMKRLDKPKEGVVRLYFPVFCTATLKPTGELIYENKLPIEWVRNRWLGVEVKSSGKCKVIGIYKLIRSNSIPLIFTLALCNNEGVIYPKQWRWGWNPKDVAFNLDKNTAVFAPFIKEFLGVVCHKE